MRNRATIFASAAIAFSLTPAPLAANSADMAETASHSAQRSSALLQFAPKSDAIRHRIDYSIWTEALSNFVISMGPPLRRKPFEAPGPLATRTRMAHNSIYRLDGSMVGFSFMNAEIIASFTEYREDLQRVAETLDITTLPRNEQLSFWLNLHNVAMVEQIAKEWPVRQPYAITIGGAPLDDAKFITVRGVALSLSDIRQRIVYPNWSDPKVIYGFWRGEIGGPAMQRSAFEGKTVSDMLERSAREFTNSRRGTEKRGKTLHVSELYSEAAPFYFAEFNTDLREHLLDYVNDDVRKMVTKTTETKASIKEHDIADLAGGSRGSAFFANGRVAPGVASLIAQRRKKFDFIERKGLRTGTVTFSNIQLPGDDPDKGEVK